MNSHKISLFLKFSGITTLMLVIVMSVSSLILIRIQTNTLFGEMQKNSNRLTDFVANTSALHIENYSYYALDDIANQLQKKDNKDNDILSIMIFSDKNKLLNPMTAIKETKINTGIKNRHIIEKDVYSTSSENLKIGKVRIIFSLEAINNKIRSMKFSLITVILLTALLTNLIIIILLLFMIIKPLSILNSKAKQIAHGDFNISFKKIPKDEMGNLGHAFINMSENLKKSFNQIDEQKKEIEKYNLHLEELVESRTSELKEAHDRMKLDLQIAQRIQQAIIPKEFIMQQYFNVYGMYLPMDNLGGDYYDVFKISETKIGIVIADVCGHGVPAALITTMTKMSFFNNAKKHSNTHEVAAAVNSELFQVIGNMEYLTAFYCTIDMISGNFEYTNAGHNDVFIINKDTGDLKSLTPNSPIIGMVKNVNYKSETIQVAESDRIILFTDGVIELRNEKRELFGADNFINLLIKNNKKSPEQLINIINDELNNYKGKNKSDDDITLLVVDIISELDKLNVDINYIHSDTSRIQDFEKMEKRYEKSYEHYKNKDYLKTIKILKDIDGKFNRKDDNFKVNYLLGYAYYKNNQLKKALYNWEKALSYKPDNKDLLHNISIASSKLKP